MVQAVTNTAQLSTFTLIRDILRNNSTISQKFKIDDFHLFEPSLKSLTSTSLPYIVIEIPDTETELLTYDHATTLKEFTIPITLAVSYEARDKFTTYAEAIIYQIEASSSTLEASGFINTRMDITNTGVDIIKDKRVCVAQFDLMLTGRVER